jgi:molybdopterin synthase sulfur carrier subunit
MKVKAEFFALLREKAGMAALEVEFMGDTVIDLISALDDHFSWGFREQLMEGDGLKGLVRVIVNGTDIRGLRGLYTKLKDGDTVSFFPPAAGG